MDQSSGGRTLILEKGQKLTHEDINDNLVVLFIMIQSMSRLKAKESLRVFQDSGGYESFFPLDHRYDFHTQLIEKFPNLDTFSSSDTASRQIKTSLGNAIRITNPFIIIDEMHKVFTEQAKATIDNLNPVMVLGLSATPRPDMNILVTITGVELKDEDMIKLDLNIIEPKGRRNEDWKPMIRELKEHRENLEKKANKFFKNEGIYIRPIALIQVEATGKEQRGLGRVHSLDVKTYLIQLGISENEIAIKTSSQNDIEDVDLLSRECNIRYVITKEALKEGWDCPFAYSLGIIPNVGSTTGVTQLVGRILRQPYARKTKIKELDESYVFYVKGDTLGILNQVDAGFKREGLEGLLLNVKIQGNEDLNASKNVKIKPEFRKKFSQSFYLPVWLMMEKRKRKFNYHHDVKSKLKFDDITFIKDYLQNIENSLSNENKDRSVINITLNDESKLRFATKREHIGDLSEINISYMTRRISDVVENAFLSRTIAIEAVNILKATIDENKIQQFFGFITSQITNMLLTNRFKQEEQIFDDLIKSDELVLVISKHEKLGYCIPQEDIVFENRLNKTYKYYLFEEADVKSMNKLEKKVGEVLDNQDKIIWWFKNKSRRDWYSIQGWRQNKVYPDFVAAKKNDKGKLELVYVIESKGEHLIGNDDTLYKDKLFKKINKARLNYYQPELNFNDEVREKVEFYVIEQGKEEAKVKELYN